MQDGIINETGDSRYLRTVAAIRQLAPTYDAFLELLVKGELPVDLNGINPDGWAQLGTALNKANLLTDATAALMELGPEATPNDMFAALANIVSGISNYVTIQDLQKLLNRDNAVNIANTSYGTVMARGIYAGTADMTPGVSELPSGVIYLVYE